MALHCGNLTAVGLGDESQIQSDLPFAGTDAISVLDELGRQSTLGGRIEDISGETLTILRSGSTRIELFRISDIVELSFAKTPVWDSGLRFQASGDHRKALEYFDKALKSESRPWAWNELQASAVKECIANGDRVAAVERIEQIFSKDKLTRHVCLLPLVWDGRLPDSERVQAVVGDLASDSVIRQLVAASTLLDQSDHRTEAEAMLERIRRTTPSRRIVEMAEAQLWRVYLLDANREFPLTSQWGDRVSQMPVFARSGPQYVVGRLLKKQHQYDRAALAFMWMPLMAPIDPALSAQSLAEGIACLGLSGRQSEADALAAELQQRFPQTSAAMSIRNAKPTPDKTTRVP